MIRNALIDEIKTLNQLIKYSAGKLSQEDYTSQEIEGAIHFILV